jgi:hypothetical protein
MPSASKEMSDRDEDAKGSVPVQAPAADRGPECENGQINQQQDSNAEAQSSVQVSAPAEPSTAAPLTAPLRFPNDWDQPEEPSGCCPCKFYVVCIEELRPDGS